MSCTGKPDLGEVKQFGCSPPKGQGMHRAHIRKQKGMVEMISQMHENSGRMLMIVYYLCCGKGKDINLNTHAGQCSCVECA